jgi:hypothetical protein
MTNLTQEQEEILLDVAHANRNFRQRLERETAQLKEALENELLRPVVARADYALIPVSRIATALGTKDYNTARRLLPEKSDTLKR